jgi:very-short-patch-repair endonuclease
MHDFSSSSSKKIVLTCDVCNHNQETSPTSLSKNSFKCRYCNSVGSKHPHLVAEWSDKNKKSPYEYAAQSTDKVWWKCAENGHEWNCRIGSRTYDKTGCPKCKGGSKGEKAIAKCLDELGVDYVTQYRQMINGLEKRYDFYLPKNKLFIEVHGVQHFEENTLFTSGLEYHQENDRIKQEYAEQNGYYMMIDYRETDVDLAVERFDKQFDDFLNRVAN